jgi:hypothetical protein
VGAVKLRRVGAERVSSGGRAPRPCPSGRALRGHAPAGRRREADLRRASAEAELRRAGAERSCPSGRAPRGRAPARGRRETELWRAGTERPSSGGRAPRRRVRSPGGGGDFFLRYRGGGDGTMEGREARGSEIRGN